MFTGIIEAMGTVEAVTTMGGNKTFWVRSPLSDSLKVDQSIAHDGVCLTVEALRPGSHQVTAIAETLDKTALGGWVAGRQVNLERSLQVGSRLDGHFVQGHVDATAICTQVKSRQGSWEYTFQFPKKFAPLVIEKGSIAINGTSLTCFDVGKKSFRVAVIPYTYEHTTIRYIKEGDAVNLEFDMIGKYLVRREVL